MLFRYEAQSAPVLANDVGLSQVVDRLCALDDPHWHPPLRLQPAVAEESRSAVNQWPAMGTINWSLGENLTQECQQSGFDIVGRRPPNLALVCGQLWQCLQRFLAATSTLLFEELRDAIWCNSQKRVWWLPSAATKLWCFSEGLTYATRWSIFRCGSEYDGSMSWD